MTSRAMGSRTDFTLSDLDNSTPWDSRYQYRYKDAAIVELPDGRVLHEEKPEHHIVCCVRQGRFGLARSATSTWFRPFSQK